MIGEESEGSKGMKNKKKEKRKKIKKWCDNELHTNGFPGPVQCCFALCTIQFESRTLGLPVWILSKEKNNS